MTGKTVLQCEFRDFMPSMEIIGEISQDEYNARKKVKTSTTNMKDSQQDDEYLIGGLDTIELNPTSRINRNKPQITTQQRILQIEKDRVTEKMDRSRGFGTKPSN